MRSRGLTAAFAALAAPQMTTATQAFVFHEPDNRGRRQEKEAIRMAKAEAKRRRKLDRNRGR